MESGAPGGLLTQRRVAMSKRHQVAGDGDVALQPKHQPTAERDVRVATRRWIIQHPGDADQPHRPRPARDRDLTVEPLGGEVVADLSAEIYGRPPFLGDWKPAAVELPLVGIARSKSGVRRIEEADLAMLRQADADDEGGKVGDLPQRGVAAHETVQEVELHRALGRYPLTRDIGGPLEQRLRRQ